MSLRIRRGTNVQRSGVTFDLGEIVWTTDTKQLFVGDGTQGGKNILSTSAGTGLSYDGLTDGGVLKLNDTYVTSLVTDQFVHSGHSGISFAIEDDVIVATVDVADANEAAIRDIVTAMFDPTSTSSTDPTIDLEYTYNQGLGNIYTSLNPDRVKFYAESLLTSGDSVHTNISFLYDEEMNVINATVSDNTIKDVSANILTDNAQHTGISFIYDTNTNKIAATVSGFLESASPILEGDLDLSSNNIVGNGNISINGFLSLTEQSATPGVQPTGTIALADGDSWNPLESTSGAGYPVYYDGTNWLYLSDYQNKNVYFVDSTRTDGHTPTGTIINPFYTLSDALIAASNGLNELFPTYVVLMANVQENVVLDQPNIFITGISSGAKDSLVKIIGSVTVNASVNYANFSISNVQIDGSGLDSALLSTGTFIQSLSLKNVRISGNTVNETILISNNNPDSSVSFDDCELSGDCDTILKSLYAGITIKNSSISNFQYDSNGIELGGNTLTVTDTNMAIPLETGFAVVGGSNSSVQYHNVSFTSGTNQNISTDITLTLLASTFLQ